MDPHQRLVLELAWEALENARVALTRDAAAGVFIGAISNDHAALLGEARAGHTLTSSQPRHDRQPRSRTSA